MGVLVRYSRSNQRPPSDLLRNRQLETAEIGISTHWDHKIRLIGRTQAESRKWRVLHRPTRSPAKPVSSLYHTVLTENKNGGWGFWGFDSSLLKGSKAF